jgi:tripeptide aminopeptidase
VTRVLDTFLELAAIDSPSGEEAACGRYVAAALASAGMSVYFDDSAERTGSDSGNLVARLDGTAPGLRLLLSGHLDTVQPGRGVQPVVEDGVVRAAGETILGGDDKAGIAAIIEAVRRVVESGEPHADIVVVMTTGEELGLQGAKALDPAELDGAALALVLDAHGAPGGIVEGAPTHWTFVAEFEGRASHAGVEPEAGVSAIRMAADAIAAMRLGRLDDMTTANIGTIEGGIATNVVAASCRVTGECRSLDRERVDAVREEMDRHLRDAASALGGRVDVRWTKEYDGFLFPQDDPLVVLVEDACRDAGVEPRRFRTGGGSDGSIFTGHGLPSLVLSTGMAEIHSTAEYLRVADLEALTDIVEASLKRAVV